MVIAVNAIFLQKDALEGYGHYAREILRRMVVAHPEHEFIFVFDRPFSKDFLFSSNVKAIQVGPPARHVAAFLYWYNVSAPLALRKYKPALWIQPYGFCSLTTGIPQLLVVHDLAFRHFPDQVGRQQRWHYQQFTPRFLRKATRIVTVSEFSKTDIEQHYPFTLNKINVIPGAAREGFRPVEWEDKAAVKQRVTAGCEYFLCVGGISPRKNMMTVLKAFSLFKKWHKSNMKLVFAGRLAWQYEDFLSKLKSYKYRDDVVLTGYLPEEELEQLTASAYAAVYVSNLEGFGLPMVEAMQCGVPVIAANNSSMPELGGHAALYADAQNPQQIAEFMQLLYRDEKYRQVYVDRGMERASLFNWDRSAAAFWKEILATVPVSS
jgi:glycosyltransferase involved in cell wall biosynthesis